MYIFCYTSFLHSAYHCYKQMTDKQNKYFQASLSVNNGWGFNTLNAWRRKQIESGWGGAEPSMLLCVHWLGLT